MNTEDSTQQQGQKDTIPHALNPIICVYSRFNKFSLLLLHCKNTMANFEGLAS